MKLTQADKCDSQCDCVTRPTMSLIWRLWTMSSTGSERTAVFVCAVFTHLSDLSVAARRTTRTAVWIRGTSSQDAIVLRRNVAIETLRHPSENTGPALSHLHCSCTAIDLTIFNLCGHVKTRQIKGLLALTFTNSKMIGMAQPTPGRRMDQTFRRLLLGGSG